MSGPAARGPNTATLAEQAAEAFKLRRAGMSIDRIAHHMGLSHGTVCNRISRAVTDLVQPEAEAYRTLQEGRLDDGLRQVYRVLADKEADADTRLRAVDRLVRLEERRSKLLGLDAPESLVVTERRQDEETSQIIVNTLVTVLSVLGLDDHRRSYAILLAAWELNGREGEPPEPPAELPQPDARPALSGPYTMNGMTYLVYQGVRYDRVGTYRPAELPAIDAEVIEDEDDAEAVRAELVKIQDEFGHLLNEEDDDGPEGSERDQGEAA
ncbi:sigma factor-like helix-turn-helix DNA-binding protein [Streptomyces sp. NPDC002599]|uniref:sigma factor-like helix-turn-helix DNA-binding protein n=1 Tax=Streptomyces sp. NPDC002599 TaxID=3154421 RepID=UPI003332D143